MAESEWMEALLDGVWEALVTMLLHTSPHLHDSMPQYSPSHP